MISAKNWDFIPARYTWEKEILSISLNLRINAIGFYPD